jgi:hypothetical protein
MVIVWLQYGEYTVNAKIAQVMNSGIPVLIPGWVLSAVLALATLISGVVGVIYLGRLYKTGRAALTWTSFVTGPGAVQLSALTVGMLLGSVGGLAGSFGEVRSDAAALFQWRVDVTKQPLFTTGYIDVARYRYIGILSRVTSPKNGRATVVIYGIDESGRAGEVRRIDTHTGDWSLWQSRNSAKRVRLGVERSDGSLPITTKVELALVLDQASPQRLADVLPTPTTTTAAAGSEPSPPSP